MPTIPPNLRRFKIIGKSPAMQRVSNQIYTIAPLPDHVLITGERGTGKELAAHAIHKLSQYRGNDMVTIDCAALHPSTAEASLFGNERGAFTGAVNKRIGYIESAEGGTLFLDEISTLPLELQVRFLRFLEEGTITRIGNTKPKEIHVRVIAASNKILQQEVDQHRFLPDLYDRLNVFQVTMPPLREREQDCLLLLEHFMGKSFNQLTDEAKDYIRDYPFPGNVRELRHLSRRLTVFYPDHVIKRNDIQSQLEYSPKETILPNKEKRAK